MTRSAPVYVRRIARLPLVFEHLAMHPDGLPLRELADHFDVPATQLREDLLAFFTADVDPTMLLGLSRPGVLEFLGPDGDEADPNDADVVRVVDVRHADELGVEHVDASELALIYTAARSLLEMEPDDADLAQALDVLTETMLGAPEESEVAPLPWNRALEPVNEAQRRRLKVEIVYSRSWHAGVTRRVVEPYRLVKTHRGWGVDAGPVDDEGRLRTFLLPNVREATVLDEAFEAPPELPRLLDEQRGTTVVRLELPQSARWAADMYAEHVTVVDDRELSVELDVELLPPLKRRLGLMLLASGPGASVVEPAELRSSGAELARELLEHHRRGGSAAVG